jgi:hypothetical protein
MEHGSAQDVAGIICLNTEIVFFVYNQRLGTKASRLSGSPSTRIVSQHGNKTKKQANKQTNTRAAKYKTNKQMKRIKNFVNKSNDRS